MGYIWFWCEALVLQHLAWDLLFSQSSGLHHWAPKSPHHHPPINPNCKQRIPRSFPKCCCEAVPSHRDLSLTQPYIWIDLPPKGLQSWEFNLVTMIWVHLEARCFYRLSEFTFITMFLNFMNYFANYFTILNFITDLNFVYDRAFSMNDSGTRVEFMPDPEWNCLGFHCPCILQTAFTHICAY